MCICVLLTVGPSVPYSDRDNLPPDEGLMSGTAWLCHAWQCQEQGL